MAAEQLLGVGFYTIPDAARIVRVPHRTLRRWAIGYTFAGGRFSAPVLSRDYPDLRSPQALSFQDLIELLLVKRFRRVAKWSLQRIRAEGAAAEKRFSVSHPFATRRVLTDGHYWYTDIPLIGEDGRPYRVIQQEPSRQLVFRQIVEPFLIDLDYEGDEVSSFYPEGRGQPIVIDRSRSFGRAIETEAGIPTRALYDSHVAGDSIEEVARWYHVSPETVHAAVAYEQKLAQA